MSVRLPGFWDWTAVKTRSRQESLAQNILAVVLYWRSILCSVLRACWTLLYFNVCLDLTPVKDLTNAMFVETDLLPKEISRFTSPDIPKVFLTSR